MARSPSEGLRNTQGVADKLAATVRPSEAEQPLASQMHRGNLQQFADHDIFTASMLEFMNETQARQQLSLHAPHHATSDMGWHGFDMGEGRPGNVSVRDLDLVDAQLPDLSLGGPLPAAWPVSCKCPHRALLCSLAASRLAAYP